MSILLQNYTCGPKLSVAVSKDDSVLTGWEDGVGGPVVPGRYSCHLTRSHLFHLPLSVFPPRSSVPVTPTRVKNVEKLFPVSTQKLLNIGVRAFATVKDYV